MSIRRNLILALLASCTLIVTGCPKETDTPDGGTDAGVDGGTDGGSDGGTDGGGGPVLGDNCDNPFEIVAGTTATGDNSTFLDDYGSACADSNAPSQPDVAYHFTVTEASGLEVTMTGVDPFDGVLILFASDCLSGSEMVPDTGDGRACVDATYDVETFSIGLLPPGEYYLVVDGFDAGGAFSLDLTLTPGGICIADSLEGDAGNETAADASGVSPANLDTSDLGDPNTPDPDPFPLNLCSGDTDVFLIGHMGGDLGVTVADSSSTITTEVLEAVIDPATGDTSEGTSLGATPYTGTDAPRGYYLLKLSASAPPVTGSPYFFALTHTCEGDSDDAVLPAEDDEVYERAVYGFYDSPGAGAIDRSLCMTDKDVYVLQNIVVGDITVDITGGADFLVTVDEVIDDGNGGKTTQAYAGTVTQTPSTPDLQIVLSAAPVGEYVLTLALPGTTPQTDNAYGLDAIFAGFVGAGAPANDLCSGAGTLVAGATPTPLDGYTFSGTDDLVGPCGSEQTSIDAGGPGANDVFYYLNITADTAAQIDFDGSITRFFGQVYLLANPTGTCPADLSTLTPATLGDGSPACATGSTASLRIPTLTAGDYLAVVDGVYSEAFLWFPESWTEGGFNISATTFAGGLPELAACAAATTLTLPASGASITETFDNTALSSSFGTYPCTGGGSGFDKVYTLSPAADTAVTITASGYDTVLALREADCEFGSIVECNDDNDPPGSLGSQITTTLTGGTTYFLIVDAYGSSAVGTATVTIATQ